MVQTYLPFRQVRSIFWMVSNCCFLQFLDILPPGHQSIFVFFIQSSSFGSQGLCLPQRSIIFCHGSSWATEFCSSRLLHKRKVSGRPRVVLFNNVVEPEHLLVAKTGEGKNGYSIFGSL